MPKEEKNDELSRNRSGIYEAHRAFYIGRSGERTRSKVAGGDTLSAILATLLGCQGLEVYKNILPTALDSGLSPVMVKEMVYQAVDYLGIGRVMPFLAVTNDILTARGVELPLPSQAQADMEDRLQKGVEAQAQIFGENLCYG